MAGPTDLYALALSFLEACQEAVALAPGGPIARAFVAPGPPAWDCCPQLTVHAGGPAEADTLPFNPPLIAGRRPDDIGAVHLVNLTATVIRCVPAIGKDMTTFPSAASLDAAAQQTLGDLWSIWNHLRHRYQAKTLFTRGDGERRELIFDPAVPLNTAGGCGGWQIQIRTAFDGYPA